MTIFRGEPVKLIGQPLKVGDQAPDFRLINTELELVSLSDFDNYYKLISVIPSVDTGICDIQTRKFNEMVATIDKTVVITVSVDLPFAQKKWCGSAGINSAIMLSDYRERQFAKDYGVLMEEWMLLSRAIFVLDDKNKIRYVEYLENVNSHPDYEQAIHAIKSMW